MASIIKANQLQDFGGNSIITSDGAGTITLSSGMNTAVAAGTNNTPAFLARSIAQQDISDNTFTKVQFTSEDYDTDNAYNTSTGEFTVPSGKGGKYFFTSHFRLDSTTDSSRLAMIIQVNGVAKAIYNNVQRDEDSCGVSLVIDLNAGDQVRAVTFQNTGAAKNSKTEGNVMFMGYKLIGA